MVLINSIFGLLASPEDKSCHLESANDANLLSQEEKEEKYVKGLEGESFSFFHNTCSFLMQVLQICRCSYSRVNQV